MKTTNDYLKNNYLPAFNAEFSHPAREQGSAFVPLAGINLDEYLCERYERVVGKDNCVRFEGLSLQIPQDRHRYHYVKARVKVLRHMDDLLCIHHGPRQLAHYTADGVLLRGEQENRQVA